MRLRGMRLTLVIVACVLAGLAPARLAVANESGVVQLEQVEEGFGATLYTDRPAYRVGETIHLTFDAFNHTQSAVVLDFTSGQRCDFVIEGEEGDEVWRWSEGRMFTAEVGKVTLSPANPRLICEADYEINLAPGRYWLTGMLTDSAELASATVAVDVK